MERFFLIYNLLMFLTTWSIAQSELTTTTQAHLIYAADIEKFHLEIDANLVELKSTKSKRIIIEQKIATSISNEKILQYIIKQRRYDITKIVDRTTNTVIVQAPKLSNTLIIKGELIIEAFHYIIYVPEHIHTQLLNDETAPINLN